MSNVMRRYRCFVQRSEAAGKRSERCFRVTLGA
jgi:hypothetical protein